MEQERKTVVATFGNEEYTDYISQAYVITPEGRRARNRGLGNKHPKQNPKERLLGNVALLRKKAVITFGDATYVDSTRDW